MANLKPWVVKTFCTESGSWEELVRLETYSDVAAFIENEVANNNRGRSDFAVDHEA